MDLDLRFVLALLAVAALSILVTGPGLWSDAWGWWWTRRPRREPPSSPGRGGGARP